MANDNNKINDLVPNADDDQTSELESLHVTARNSADLHGEADSDEDTFDFERLERVGELSDKSIAALKSDIKSRNESISRLQFDIEQLRSRWTGLEKEISAREELTDRLNEQLLETRQKLSVTSEQLKQREAEIETLQSSFSEKAARLSSVEKEALNISETVESGKSVIEQLQNTVTAQQSTIRSLHEKADLAVAGRQTAEDELTGKSDEIAKLKQLLSASDQSREDASNDAARLKAELRDSADEIRAALEKDRHQAMPGERPQQADLGQTTAQQGLLAYSVQELRELKIQIERTELYADGLRSQLQSARSSSGNSQQRCRQLEAALADASGQISELTEQLETEKLINADLLKAEQQNQQDFADEIAKIRFELGSAQETITGHESVNEQLASDLIDNQSFRQALESQLESQQKESDQTVRDLRRTLKQLEQANEDIERKLANKDNAIAALLSELASRSRTIESIGEIENVIHEIDGRMSDRIDEKSAGEKDRMARLLIGNVDGQELQFPLFKDRLTIGRTAHNDIQLKAQFISRRHALIVTENEQSRIVDWGSKNGVYVNDSRIADQVLKNGDIVAIGTAEFRYEERPKR